MEDAILENLHRAIADLKPLLEAFKEAQQQVSEQVMQLKSSIGDDIALRDQTIAHLYWYEENVAITSITDAFGLDLDAIRAIAFKEHPDIRCVQCDGLLVSLNGKKTRRSLMCVSCASIKRTAADEQELATRLAKAKKVKAVKLNKEERDREIQEKSARAKERELQEKQEKIAALRALPYKDYLKTSHWQKKRYSALKRASNRCQLCNEAKAVLNVHHRTYDNLGDERYTDLIVLCEGCHATFHRNGKLART